MIESPPDFRGVFRTDLLARAMYAEGAGIARCVPAGVAVPVDADDVPALMRWGKREGIALMPRGSGSGMAAGAVGPGVIVDLSRLRHLGPVDVDERVIRVGAGATRGEIDDAGRRVGLRFPVDPSSGAFCTIGGMVGANAAGARTLKFGATRPWVHGVRCVFDDGTDVWVRRGEPWPIGVPAVRRVSDALSQISAQLGSEIPAYALTHAGVRKESSGYAIADALRADGHLVDLLVGSEGTLAIFTEVELSLIPAAGATATILAIFDSLEAATACAVEARIDGATACELLDRTFLDVAATDGPTGIPSDAEAVLLMEVEGESAAEALHAMTQLAARATRHGASDVHTAVDADSEHRLWALRHAASPILSRLAPRLRSMQFIEDGCVPPDRFPDYVRGVRRALDHFDMPGVIFGHAGDAHAHVNPLVDVTRAGWRDRVHGILDRVCELTAVLGGTLSGEHGDGRLRAPLMDRVWGLEARGAFAHVKDAADPSGVLNPGCKIAREGDRAISTLRHDPDAPPLPPAARAALDDIERTRSWNRFRLDGLEG
ncbi:FAD-binding oxidoreductase [Gemmatimonas groenlandica]|uniref:FAD-binding oxidoreductase n=1 Tax=Gemmatimonas groenlandica TaxID=2732249 RepID=A0A6M4IRB9_9BACT|nr:FAD-binding oxidoreductase [Gemmatimonas groenlandica]QJR36319.1 FAD-binding oxidoreductase [Gemmatimonas groenlandica]